MKKLLDEVDLQISRLLQNEGRMASSEIAKTIGIPEATIRYRLKKLMTKSLYKLLPQQIPLSLVLE